jgi:hypothetical protein
MRNHNLKFGIYHVQTSVTFTVLLVHVNVDNEDIRYTSTSATTTTENNDGSNP